MPNVIIGKPEDEDEQQPKLKDDNEVLHHIHDNLYCTISYKPDGVYVDGWGKNREHVFGPKHFPNDAMAQGFIEKKREMLGKADEDEPGSRTQ